MRTDVEACGLAGVLYPAAALSAALLFTASPARALQVIDARDGVSVEAILSIKEPTRIRIEGVPIMDVFGNIHSSNCGSAMAAAPMSNSMSTSPASPAVSPAGKIVLEYDRDKEIKGGSVCRATRCASG